MPLDCFQLQVLNQYEAVLWQVEVELKPCKTRAQRQFGYGNLIVSFILERVLVMRPRMSLNLASPREPKHDWCAALAPQMRGWMIRHFFEWLKGQIPMIKDYLYASMNYTRDPELYFHLMLIGGHQVRGWIENKSISFLLKFMQLFCYG